MGRHSSGTRVGLRSGLKSSSPAVLLSVLLVLALVGWFTFDFLSDRLGASGCDSSTVINVTAAPELAPVVTQIGKQASEEEGEGCYKVNVTGRDSASTADSLVLSEGTVRPDVWIPESTLWLQRAQSKGAWRVPVSGTSVASSPVVLAMTEDVATQLGWPSQQPGWTQLLGKGRPVLNLGFADPARSPAALSTLFGIQGLYLDGPDPKASITTMLRELSANTVVEESELFTLLPGAVGEEEPLDAFPTSEIALLRHNLKQDISPLVAAYPEQAVPALDYPYVVLPETAGAKRKAAENFLTRLLSGEAANAFADAGLRNPDGIALRDRSADRRVSSDTKPPQPLPDAAEVDRVLNEWAGVNRSGRVLVLLDVSGSMNEPVGQSGQTRMTVTIEAAIQGIGLFKPTTKVGVWLFSTNLNGNNDYVELLPVETVSDHLSSGAVEKLRSVQARGATGLYDSTLAAYQSAAQSWEAGRINTVVVMTDGRNEDPNGISREQLLTELGTLQDPRRPLPIVGIGVGPDISVDELDAITEATGGEAFTTPNPAKIGDVFYAALSRMLCQPPDCQA